MRLPISLLLLALAPASAEAQRRSAQAEAFEARREGRIQSIRTIEGRIIPTMKGAEYLGFDFDAGATVYTLKFLRDGTVIWVHVDGRSGHVIGRTDR